MGEIAAWVAPIATAIAAMMTASNLGPRVTGWGFAVFVLASLAWVAVALATNQPNLLLANAFLTLVNLAGVWRWLGRRARYEDGAEATAPSLFAMTSIADSPMRGADGGTIGYVVDAMADCERGTIVYVMVREGGAAGVGERLHALDWGEVVRDADGFRSRLTPDDLARRPVADPAHWPDAALR